MNMTHGSSAVEQRPHKPPVVSIPANNTPHTPSLRKGVSRPEKSQAGRAHRVADPWAVKWLSNVAVAVEMGG